MAAKESLDANLKEKTSVSKGINYMFKPSVLKRHYSLVPILAIPAYALALSAFFLYHTGMNHTDVRWANKDDDQRWAHDEAKPKASGKLYNPHPEIHKLNPDVEVIKDKMKKTSNNPAPAQA